MNPLRILIVDDDPMVRLLVRESLAQDAFQVVEAECGETGLELFRATRPDIVLLDILMPGLDGFACLQAIRAMEFENLRVPIVMLTGVEDEASVTRAFELGATDFISKPVHWALLPHRLRYVQRNAALTTALADSEMRFCRLVKVVPISLGYVAKSGEIRYLNDRFVQVFGYTLEDIPTIEEWWRLACPDQAYRQWAITTWNAAVQTAAESGQDIQPIEYRVAGKHGDVRIMEISGVILGDDLLVTFIDLTARKQAEAELTQHRQHLEQLVKERTEQLVQACNAAETANRAKSVFLANMSHELRTPLNAILGFAQIMERDARIPEDERCNLKTINRSGQHLLSLINDVLEISRIEAGRTSVQNDVFELADSLCAIEKTIRTRAQAKGLDFVVEPCDGLPRFVYGDAHHLRQVLINLLGNAVKYTDQGTVTLRLAPDDGHIRFEVIDTGPGIAAEEQKHIFQPFYQTEFGMAKGEGTGLGLAISHEFVRLMGGKIELRSQPGRGSTFAFTLPLRETGAPAASASARQRIAGLAPNAEAEPALAALMQGELNSAVSLNGISEILRAELAHAAELLDAEAMQAIIERIQPDHPELALAIAACVDAYRFDAVAKLCRRGEQPCA